MDPSPISTSTIPVADVPTRRPGFLRAFARAMTRRCPKCGGRGVFRQWVSMVEDCPTCGLHFERSPGYWLGAVALNMAITMGTFLVVFVTAMVVTWPDVPWDGLLVGVILVSALTPVVAHPFSRLVWVALERHFRIRTEPDI